MTMLCVENLYVEVNMYVALGSDPLRYIVQKQVIVADTETSFTLSHCTIKIILIKKSYIMLL